LIRSCICLAGLLACFELAAALSQVLSQQSPLQLDLDADTDRDGFVSHSLREEELEDADGEQGLIVLPNWDDDDPPGTKGHGVPDCLVENRFSQAAFADRKDRFDNEVNGPSDREEDMQVLLLRKVPALPPGARILLRVSPADAEKVRIFDEKDRAVIAPAEAARFISGKAGSPYYEHEVANLAGPADQYLEYHVEGIAPGERLRIELVAVEGDRELARDTVKVRVAPFLLVPNEQPVRQVFTADFRGLPPTFRLTALPGLTVEEDGVRQAASELAPMTPAPPTDTFWQDSLQSGYAQAPGPGRVRTMVLLARLPRGARNFWAPNAQAGISSQVNQDAEANHWLWPNRPSNFLPPPSAPAYPALLGPGVGVFEIPGSAPRSISDYGGNLEVTWPSPEQRSAFGRAVVGREMSAPYRDFLNRQEVQTPLVQLDLGWLFNRHVDDVVYFLGGRQIVVPSPALGEQLLRDLFEAGPNPSRTVFRKGGEVLNGQFTAVEPEGEYFVLMDADADLSRVHPGMYLHIYAGPGRYQTYDIIRSNARALVVQKDIAPLFSYWRTGAVEAPTTASRYVIVEKPLHDSRSGVKVITLPGLFNRDNPKVREFWDQNQAAQEAIDRKILPELRKLSPSGIIRLPVLFHQLSLTPDRNGSAAFTPNLVNGHLLGNTFLMPKPFVQDKSDPFEEAAKKALGAFGTRFVDNYFQFHNYSGEIHCALNLILEPPSGRPFWWETIR